MASSFRNFRASLAVCHPGRVRDACDRFRRRGHVGFGRRRRDGRPLPDDAAEEQVIRYVARGFGRLNPAAEGGFGRFIIAHMFMPFFIRDAEHNLSPWLATGIDASDDLTVYTIHIHPDAVWNDSSPVLAQEAKDYWDYGLHPDKCIGCYLSRFTGFDLIEGAQAVITLHFSLLDFYRRTASKRSTRSYHV